MPDMKISRRLMLGATLTAASGVGLGWGEPLSPQSVQPRVGDGLVAVGDAARLPLRAEAIERGGAPVLAWPIDRATRLVRDGSLFNQVLLLRLPEPDDLIAFSAICQHASCVVSEWLPRDRLLRCPCHGSEYDPAHRGAVVAGPAPAPLPMLPLQIVDHVVTIAGSFSAKVGGQAGRTD